MTTEEYLATYIDEISLSGLSEGYGYDADSPTYWNEKLAYMLCALINRCASLPLTVKVEKVPGYAVTEAIALVLPRIELRTSSYDVVISSEGEA